MTTPSYEDARRIVREHEESMLAEVKAKSLTSEYADVPRARGLARAVWRQETP